MNEIIRQNIATLSKKYLKSKNETSIDNLSLEQAESMFLDILKDFKKGKISCDELSSFGFEFFHGIGKKHPQSDLFRVSLSASELTFAIRSETVYSNVPSYLTDLDNFLKKHR